MIFVVLLSLPPSGLAQQSVPVWRVDAAHRIGSVNDPDESFSLIRQALIGPMGQIIIAQPQDHAIRVYDGSGRPVRTIGRKGEGPGEFLSVDAIGLLRDTLYVADNQLRRLTFFSLDGRFIRSALRASPGLRGERVAYLPTVPQVLLRDGSALVEPKSAFRPAAGPLRSPITVPIMRIDRNGRVTDTLFWREQKPMPVVVESPSGKVPIADPFDRKPLHLILLDGSGIAIIERENRTQDQPSFLIRKIAPTGETIFSRSYRYAPTPMSPDAVKRTADAVLLQLTREGRAGPLISDLTSQRIEASLRKNLKIPTTQVPLTAAVSGQDGSIWLQREPLPGGMANWEVLDNMGTVRGRVRLPANQAVIAAKGDLLVTLTFDDLHVPFVIVNRILK